MCQVQQGQQGCQKPRELKGKPEECTPEQIRICHGEVADHPCVVKKGQ